MKIKLNHLFKTLWIGLTTLAFGCFFNSPDSEEKDPSIKIVSAFQTESADSFVLMVKLQNFSYKDDDNQNPDIPAGYWKLENNSGPVVQESEINFLAVSYSDTLIISREVLENSWYLIVSLRNIEDQIVEGEKVLDTIVYPDHKGCKNYLNGMPGKTGNCGD